MISLRTHKYGLLSLNVLVDCKLCTAVVVKQDKSLINGHNRLKNAHYKRGNLCCHYYVTSRYSSEQENQMTGLEKQSQEVMFRHVT